MRLTLVNKYYPPHVGGIEFHVRDLAEALAAAGHQVRVIVCNNEQLYTEEVAGGVEIVRLPRRAELASTPIAHNFGRVLAYEARSADLLHFHFPYPWSEAQWVLQQASKTTPYVVTYHSDIVRQKLALRFYQPFLNRFLDRARLIIASSPQLIASSPYLGARADKCRQVNFGLPTDLIAHDQGAIARAAELREQFAGAPIVLFVGRLVYYKGIEVLAHAAGQVAGAQFVVIGKGPERATLEGIVTAAGARDRLHIIDYADDAELRAWYHAADLLTLPSTSPSEAFGLVQIEAHAAGTPVVSSDLPTGVTYANLDGITGLTTKTGDPAALAAALNRLLADDPLRKKLGAQAQSRALTDFSIKAMLKATTHVYHEALGADEGEAARKEQAS
ncbi:MAG: glycosyltransferase [Actinomycetia bacterium]|nr:glycosyltransferase [Actinomycetes bacterium]